MPEREDPWLPVERVEEIKEAAAGIWGVGADSEDTIKLCDMALWAIVHNQSVQEKFNSLLGRVREGVLTRDEALVRAREIWGLPPIDGGDDAPS